MSRLLCLAISLFALQAFGAESIIVSGAPDASRLERLAAGELVRYLDAIARGGARPGDSGARMIRIGARLPGVETPSATDAYRLEYREEGGREVFLISGADPRGTLYGAYDFLERCGITFTITEDLLPPEKVDLGFPRISESVAPAISVRGLLPWPDFLNGITAWDLDDYKSTINQMLKLRMNALMLHTYARTYGDKNWSEPFLGFKYRGVGHHAFLDTSLTERWGYNAYETSDFVWGTGDLFYRRAFGSEAAQFAPDQATVYARARWMMREAITYAQDRGMTVGMGFEINLLPTEIEDTGALAFDEDVIRARLADLIETYPTVDFVQIWFSEFNRTSAREFAEGIEIVQRLLSEIAPDKRIVTGGWFVEDRLGELDSMVPEDIIFSTLIPHKGEIDRAFLRMQKGRQRWPVPWLEFDGNLWVPQPYVFGFRLTVQEAVENGIEGLFGIHWRTNELDANFDYLAHGMWGQLPPPSTYYRHYARTRFGVSEETARDIAEVLVDLEQVGLFARWDSQEYVGFFFFQSKRFLSFYADMVSLHNRLAVLREKVPEGEPRRRFQHVLDTLRWTGKFFRIKNQSPTMRTWQDVESLGIKGSIQLYAQRTTSSEEQGTLVSLTAKYYDAYRHAEDWIRARLSVQPPDQLLARADDREAVVTWRVVPGSRPAGFRVWRRAMPDGAFQTVGEAGGEARQYRDRPGEGWWAYAATALSSTGEESLMSLPDEVAIGAADSVPPQLLVSPKNAGTIEGAPVWLQVGAVDEQSGVEVTVYHRPVGDARYQRRVVRTFRGHTGFAEIPGEAVRAPGLQWYVEASDGRNLSRWPASAPEVPYSVLVEPARGATPSTAVEFFAPDVARDYVRLAWSIAGATPDYYHVLRRSRDDDWVEYARVPGSLDRFVDDEVEEGATYQYRLVPTSRTAGPGAFAEVGRVHVPAPPRWSLYINCAGRDYLDRDGRLWRADRNYNPLGGWGYLSDSGAHWLTGQTVRKTVDQELFRSIRYSGRGPLHYRFNVPNGTYTLGYRVAEIYYGVDGRKGSAETRVFSATIEDATVFRDFSPGRTAGLNTPVEKVFRDIRVEDGSLDFILVPEEDFPAACAIWVEEQE